MADVSSTPASATPEAVTPQAGTPEPVAPLASETSSSAASAAAPVVPLAPVASPEQPSTIAAVSQAPSVPATATSTQDSSPALVPVPAPAPPPAPAPALARKKLNGYVGFANLPNQMHRKSVRKGFQFTCMVVGESGLGKSTMVNTLFGTALYPPKNVLPPHVEHPSTVSIESISADIEENGVRLRLTVVDTPGFGDFVNNDASWEPIVQNIEQRFDAYLEQENRVDRRQMVDNRVLACLYFIQPTGHSLRPIDLEFMRHLHDKVNLILVIAKSDTLTDEEIVTFKQRILADIEHHGIQIFHAPVYDNDDEETLAENAAIAVRRLPASPL